MQDIRRLLGSVLQLGARADALTAESPLLGAMPELDSMAIVAVLTALEEDFGITVEDDEISAENLSTVGALARYVESKLKP